MRNADVAGAVRCWLDEPLAADVAKSIDRIAVADDVRHVAVIPGRTVSP